MDREPLNADVSRWFCHKLGWTMSHLLEENLKFMEEYKSDNKEVTFQKINGTNVPYDLELLKNEI
jgi:hypothetical protein